MTALEEETVKALTGESTMDRVFLQSLIPKRRAILEKAQVEVERIRSEINDEENARKAQQRAFREILSWADAFDTAKLETKHMIIATLIDKITVQSDYSLDIHFRVTIEQYWGKRPDCYTSPPALRIRACGLFRFDQAILILELLGNANQEYFFQNLYTITRRQ